MPEPPDPSSSSSLSCTSCRKRKIKCDKRSPCTACERAAIECVFPPKQRLPRGRNGGNRSRNVELTKRVNRLEALVAQLESENAGLLGGEARPEPAVKQEDEIKGAPVDHPFTFQDYEEVVKASRPRHLSKDFWTSLSAEFYGLRNTLDHPSDEDDDEDDLVGLDPDEARLQGSFLPDDTHFIFRSIAAPTPLQYLHPSPTNASTLCDLFFARVDPLFRVLHRPTAQASILAAASNLQLAGGKPLEALMFSVYFAAVTTLTDQECLETFGLERGLMLKKYKYGVEKALTNADFLNSMDLVPLQAFALFVLCLRAYHENRLAWTLTALLVRIGQSLYLHLDGPGASFPPLERELRRRLWWQIVVLDIRACEDRGSEPMIVETYHNTSMPTNLNDADLTTNLPPGDPTQPPAHTGATEMTFCLMLHSLQGVAGRLSYMPPGGSAEAKEKYLFCRAAKEALVKERAAHLESTILAHCDPGVPLTWVTTMVARLIILKMWLLVQYPLQTHRLPFRAELTPEVILRTAVSVLEVSEELETHAFGRPFAWFFATYVQWHPLAVALAELCGQTRGPLVERAWGIIDKVFDKWSVRVADSKKGSLWRPIKRLLAKARSARREEIRKGEEEGLWKALEGVSVQQQSHRDQQQYQQPQQQQQQQQQSTWTTSRAVQPSVEGPPLFDMSLVNWDHVSVDETLLAVGQSGTVPDTLDTTTMANLSGGGMAGGLDEQMDGIDWAHWADFVQSTWESSPEVLDLGMM